MTEPAKPDKVNEIEARAQVIPGADRSLANRTSRDLRASMSDLHMDESEDQPADLGRKRQSDLSVWELQLGAAANRIRNPSSNPEPVTIGVQTTESLNRLQDKSFLLFKELWKTTLSVLKTEAHIDLIDGFKREDLIPQGFLIGIKPAVSLDTAAYREHFNGLSKACSLQFMSLTRDHLTGRLNDEQTKRQAVVETMKDEVNDWSDRASIDLRLEQLTNKERDRLIQGNMVKLKKAKELAENPEPKQDFPRRGRTNLRNQNPARAQRGPRPQTQRGPYQEDRQQWEPLPQRGPKRQRNWNQRGRGGRR